VLLTLLPVPGQARTRRPDQAKTLGHTFKKIHTKFRVAKFPEHPRCRVGGVLVPYERKKERKKERMFIYHLHTLNSIVSTAST
jgi:hypothetical protein